MSESADPKMDTALGFLIYASIFRLAIICAGIVSIGLGYRLFVRGVMPEGTTDAEVRGGGIQLSVKNAAPGTCFALFGALIIAVMLLQGNPELVMEELEKVEDVSTAKERIRTARLKGGEDKARVSTLTAFEALLAFGRGQEELDHDQAAIAAYAQALSIPEVSLGQAAQALNQIAWIYQKQGRVDEALPLARLAVQIDEKNAAFLDTLANVLLKRGEHAEAATRARAAVELFPQNAAHLCTLALSLDAMGDRTGALEAIEKAARIDPQYESQLSKLRQHAQ